MDRRGRLRIAVVSRWFCACAAVPTFWAAGARAQAPLPPLPAPADEAPDAAAPEDESTTATPAAPVGSSPHGASRGDEPLSAGPSASAEEATASSAEEAPPPPPEAWATHPFLLELQAGLGAPLGIIGFALGFAPIPALAIDLGGGLGYAGVQYGASARVRFFRWGHEHPCALYVGAGGSMGAYHSPVSLGLPSVDGGPSAPNPYTHWDKAYWLNMETGIEIRVKEHLSIRPAVGIGRLLNPSAGSAVDATPQDPAPSVSPWQPYVSFSVGYAFGATHTSGPNYGQ